MATSRQRVEDEDSEGLGGVIHLPLASYCSKVAPRSPLNRNLDSPSNTVRTTNASVAESGGAPGACTCMRTRSFLSVSERFSLRTLVQKTSQSLSLLLLILAFP